MMALVPVYQSTLGVLALRVPNEYSLTPSVANGTARVCGVGSLHFYSGCKR